MAELVRSQVHFSGQVDCPSFQPHFLKPNFCTSCSKLLDKHAAHAVSTDDIILKALEFSQKGEKIPSLVLDSTDTTGALYLGGYKSVMNDAFLVEHKIGAIVNTAKGLENVFGPSYKRAVEKAYQDLKIEFLRTQWVDDTHEKIPPQSLAEVVKFIEKHRSEKTSVLVHCAQGKSRSATAVVAYIMVKNSLDTNGALKFVQEKRAMAEPNSGFMKALQDFERSSVFLTLRENTPRS
ncbi:uncharacterized protein LOC134177877 [Corticium candelabrum]|uniref:uncharacterized protein LOC134177877 n=1 Tax=Corticium candelabrum TaxID=121492 RepID=UPI002E277177|nr:uncharacterized protein LOC134177877 [Corticium candelabrum]